MNYSNIRDKTKHLLPGIVLKYDKGSCFYYESTNQKICFFWKNLVAAFLCTLGIFPWRSSLPCIFAPLYYFDIDHLDIPATSGYSEEVIRRNYDELIDYNSISGPSRLTFSDFTMSEEGEIHF